MHIRELLICTALCNPSINNSMNSQEEHHVLIDMTRIEDTSNELFQRTYQYKPKYWMFRAVHYTAGLCAGTIACIPLFYSEVHEPKKPAQLVLNGAIAVSGVAGATLCAIELARIARERCCIPQLLLNR